MKKPTVSFVVPCYNLAHFLPECIGSILGQTYGDFEVLIMDDCSPDNTSEAAHRFNDSRVRHVRNDTNLGALANYNKGISLSRGKYVWLISADDYLGVPYVLERYVRLMEQNSRLVYTFCPAMGVESGKEAGLLPYSACGDSDRVMPGRLFLTALLYGNLVVAPTALVRRDCYDEISKFPLNPTWGGVSIDLIWGGDWYLWCMFALHGDVGYFAEPMVCYRQHDSSSTSSVTKHRLANCFHAEVAIPWQVKRKADQAGLRQLSRECLRAIAYFYAAHLTTKYYRASASKVSMAQVDESLCGHTVNERERRYLRALVREAVGDKLYQRTELTAAENAYRAATDLQPWLLPVQVKRLLLSLGPPGEYLRRAVRRLR